MAVVGAAEDDHAGGTDAGSAYVFLRNGASWTEAAKLVASDAADHDLFGFSVAVSADTAVVGALRATTRAACRGLGLRVPLAPGARELLHRRHLGQRLPGAALRQRHAQRHGPAGFLLLATTVEGAKDGLFFLGKNGQQANPWGNGTSYQCVVPPVTAPACSPAAARWGLRRLVRTGPERDLVPTAPRPEEPRRRRHGASSALVPRPAETSNQTTSLSDALEFGWGPRPLLGGPKLPNRVTARGFRGDWSPCPQPGLAMGLRSAGSWARGGTGCGPTCDTSGLLG